MGKYINREEAIEYIKAQKRRFFTGVTIEEAVIQMLSEVPAADAVEVVRCKDCENYQTDWQPLSFDDGHYCAMVDTTMPYDGFCHMGERREDGRLNQQTGGD